MVVRPERITRARVDHLTRRVSPCMTSEDDDRPRTQADDDRPRTRADYERGLPDYHDPTAGWAGAAPTYSALTLRLWLAGIGIVLSIVVGVLWIVVADMIWPAILLFVLAAVLVVDLAWVAHRKRRGEPG